MSDPTAFELVGPLRSHDVIVGGWRVPYLTAEPMNGGIIALSLDDRLSVDIPVRNADQIIPFIADCIAVALGYASHPRVGELDELVPLSPIKRTHTIGSAALGDTDHE